MRSLPAAQNHTRKLWSLYYCAPCKTNLIELRAIRALQSTVQFSKKEYSTVQ